MANESNHPDSVALFRQDLMREYAILQDQITAHDGRIMSVKGWSVTLSLAAITLGFQTGHFALFGLAAFTASGFWFLDGLLKGYQVRHYTRINEIEVIAAELFSVDIPGHGPASSPQISWSWFNAAGPRRPPEMRTVEDNNNALRKTFVYANVMIPHVVAVGLGIALFVAAALGAPGLASLDP